MVSPNEQLPLGSLAERYWVESQRPLASLVLIAPLLLIYEIGVVWLGAYQNGADAAMRGLLEMLGLSQHFLLPMLTVGILLAWQHLSRQPWRISGGVVSFMAVESLLLGVLLRVLLAIHSTVLPLSIGTRVQHIFQNTIGYLGAGIYEELLFRLILLSLVAMAFRRAGTKAWIATVLAVAISSVLFAMAHHVGPYGEPFVLHPFLLRFVASVFFSVLYIYRGFGIAAASHAAYDILVGIFC